MKRIRMAYESPQALRLELNVESFCCQSYGSSSLSNYTASDVDSDDYFE